MRTDGSPDSVAAWMLLQMERLGRLYSAGAADEIDRLHGPPHVAYDAEGSPYLTPPIIEAFRAASGDDVVWSIGGRFWRRRVAGDKPGRDQR